MPSTPEIEEIFTPRNHDIMTLREVAESPLEEYVRRLVESASAEDISNSKSLRELLAASLVFEAELDRRLTDIEAKGPGGGHKLTSSPLIREEVDPDFKIEITRN